MPVSKKQRAWAWTPAGKKALGASKAKEWEHATDAQIAVESKKKKGHARSAAARGLASRMGGKP
jgi:hypothetical protein